MCSIPTAHLKNTSDHTNSAVLFFFIDGIISLESYWYMTVRVHGAQNYYNPMFMTLSFVTYCGDHST